MSTAEYPRTIFHKGGMMAQMLVLLVLLLYILEQC